MRDWLKQMRLENKLTQKQLSDIAGLTQQYCSLIENGDRQQNMQISVMEKLASAFDVPLEKIVYEETRYRAQVQDESA